MKSLTRKELKEVIHEIIRELQEASTTGNIAGYETPKAFAGGLKKNKDLKAKLIKKLHMKLVGKVNEHVFDGTSVDWSDEMIWKWLSKALKTAGIKELKYQPMKLLTKQYVYGCFFTVQAKGRKDVMPFYVDKKGNIDLGVSSDGWIIGKVGKLPQVVKNLKDYKKNDLMKEDLDPYKDFSTGNSWEKEYDLNLGAFVDEYQKFIKAVKKLKPIKDENKRAWAHAIRKKVGQGMFNGYIGMWMKPMEVLDRFKKFEKLPDKAGWVYEGKINEARYHEFRDDETRTPKQKIWHGVREVRDSLMKLERSLKFCIKLKNEQSMDSRTYYKYAQNSFPKIQERLIKLAKKIGELSA